MNDCIFCKIVKREIGTKIEKESQNLVVFKDVNPKAPVHFLIVPKKHFKGLAEVNDITWNEIKKLALKLAEEMKLNSFRLVNNNGDAALIKHYHVHFLGRIPAAREV